MDKKDIELHIRKCVQQMYSQNPRVFGDNIIDNMTTYKATAQAYWDIRAYGEIERDRQAGVTAADYELWIKNELYRLKTTDQGN